MTHIALAQSDLSTMVHVRTWQRVWHALALGAILLLAVGLHFYGLDQEGYANLYYAATVKSMLTSPANFLFASFDPGGFVTVDKPPLGLWVQALSVLFFGYSGWALLFPQALFGVLSVGLMFVLVRRVFGPLAGLIGALALAVSPINVAANRNNTMDSTLVFVLLLAAWAISLAAERGQLRWLLASVVLVGIGFNVKMLQAYLVLPAFFLVYLVAAHTAWYHRLWHLLVASLVLAAVSLSWALAVDLVPADARPYIGSSQDNSVMELIIGHNGLRRLLPGGPRADSPATAPGQPPQGGQPGQVPPGGNPNPPGQPAGGAQPGQFPPPIGANPPSQPFANPNAPIGPANGGGLPGQGPAQPGAPRPEPGQFPNQSQPGRPAAGPGSETGEAGPLRLFNEQLAGQASWLLPLALAAGLVATLAMRFHWPPRREHQAVLLWSVWLLTMTAFFSIASLFHRYYLEMMTPAIAALTGGGLALLWSRYRSGARVGWLLPPLLAGSAVYQAGLLIHFPEWGWWMAPLILATGLAGAAGLIVARLFNHALARAAQVAAMALGLAANLIAPTAWALTPVLAQGDAGLPYAGPELLERGVGRSELQPLTEALVEYLQANRGDARFLLGTINARTAAPFIILTGEPVMAMGGFSGGDPILAVHDLQLLIESGAVRFFLLSNDRPTDLTAYISGQCQTVPPGAWTAGSPAGPGLGGGPGGQALLYDCSPN